MVNPFLLHKNQMFNQGTKIAASSSWDEKI